jgi:ABC-2 type transport system ATP-binding protein
MKNKTVIKVHHLSKHFTYHEKEEGLKGTFKALFKRQKLLRKAVDNLSFEIKRGEFVGFIGPNGSGKTTTLKMLSGILAPTSGTVKVAGFTPLDRKDSFKKKIAIVMGQKTQLWPTLPPIESLNLNKEIYELDDATYRKKMKEMLDLLDLNKVIHVQARKLSLGERMKCELVAALLHNPEILFLDEPTIGLDVVSQETIREFLKKYNKKYQTTIILTSHYMADVADLCERLIIINNGKIGYDDSLTKIINQYSQTKYLSLTFKNKVSNTQLQTFGKILKNTPYQADLEIDTATATSTITQILQKLPIKNININDITLEEIVRDIFKNNK